MFPRKALPVGVCATTDHSPALTDWFISCFPTHLTRFVGLKETAVRRTHKGASVGCLSGRYKVVGPNLSLIFADLATSHPVGARILATAWTRSKDLKYGLPPATNECYTKDGDVNSRNALQRSSAVCQHHGSRQI